jgi:hypothetical protein
LVEDMVSSEVKNCSLPRIEFLLDENCCKHA